MISTKHADGRRFRRDSASRKRKASAGRLLLMSLILIAFPIVTPVLAADNTYTISLAPSTSAAAPGETWELHVKIHNDGWPATGTADVAAFQGTLDYDRSLAEYQTVSFPDGMMGDFNPDTGTILAYGEKQEFDESTEIAVLTFRSPEQSVGTESFAIRDLLLAKRDYTQLNPQAGEGATLTIGNADADGSESAAGDASGSGGSTGNRNPSASPAAQGDGAPSVDSAASGGSGSDAALSSGQGNSVDANGNAVSGSDENPDGIVASGGTENGASGDGTEGTNGSDSSSPQDAGRNVSDDSSADTGLRSDDGSGKNGTNPGDDSTGTEDDGTGSQNDEIQGTQSNSGSARRVAGIVALLAAVAAAAAGVMLYRKKKS